MEVDPKIFHSKINSYCFLHSFTITPHSIPPLACQMFFTEKTGIKVWVENQKCYVSDEKFLSLE